MEKPLDIIYTQNIRGDLVMLPRLYTLIQRLSKNIQNQTILIDLGDSCANDVWHCAATNGRSALLVMDAMGYHAANVNGLTQTSRDKLSAQVMFALVDDEHPYEQDDMVFTTKSLHTTNTQIILTGSDETVFNDNTLQLQKIAKGQVGVAHLQGNTLRYEIHTLNQDTLPDQIIVGIVDLVLDEVRHFKKRKR